MKTDQLISLLAADAQPVDGRAHGKRMAGVFLVGGGLAALAAGGALGWRHYSSAELMQSALWWRWAFCLGVALAAALVVSRLARPGQVVQPAGRWLPLPFVAMVGLGLAELSAVAAEDRLGLVLGSSALECPWNIAALSVPAWLAGFWALRQMAPTQAVGAGAAVGLMAGALGALGYTAHCTELAAPFIAVWYSLGMTIPAVLGACAGPRLLRW